MSMELEPDFVFRPLPPLREAELRPLAADFNPLDVLSKLIGKWEGRGFNTIWQPRPLSSGGRFLELNITEDSIAYETIEGSIPNRGFLQGDIAMTGLQYLQKISDANAIPKTALHFETGIWAVVPATTDPKVPASLVRMASIPHGTAILAQGPATPPQTGSPDIPNIDIVPFDLESLQKNPDSFSELKLSTPAPSRTPDNQMQGITQEMIDDPNSVLRDALQGQQILSTTVLQVSTNNNSFPGGGTANTAFLQGTLNQPNAVADQVTATFWIHTVKDSPDLLQYSQTVLLNFDGLSWPHVTVSTLKRQISS